MRPRFQRDLQKVARIEPEDRPPVGGNIADPPKVRRQPVTASRSGA
ncbi:hypothetical protein [Chelativorans salis]|uniref:Uncharacterized protein n=1 Tax=Chelativorans salis TaxID=2978478 RepID=A0ABT2LNF0_9HYPH|nr:hypothetical protein [Chelativorans sp. EGI FJ00035]MCT7376095.1 hypothetical protein [Chelativorans sp. EGI FJ00035]